MRWHYTNEAAAVHIIRTGALRPSSRFHPAGSHAAVWLSSNQRIELTCARILLVGEDTPELRRDAACVRYVRFGVPDDFPAIPYPEIQAGLGLSPEDWQYLVDEGRKRGATAEEWLAHVGPLDIAEIAATEVLLPGPRWIPWSIDDVDWNCMEHLRKRAGDFIPVRP